MNGYIVLFVVIKPVTGLDFYLHDRLEVMVQSYHGNINHILDELINVSIQAYSANTLVAQ